MIKIIKGDILETPADIRVNTVNCVGVMGAGVALAFKNRYPEMFREYQKDCKAGKVKPGKLHIWENFLGNWIINFPTKRHWRQPSRYEDIEAGLIALHTYLSQQIKEKSNLKITLPALGCGHGGLDWNRVFQMIKEHLSNLEAEIIVFEPSASRNAGQRIQNGENEESLEKMQSLGINTIGPGHEIYPAALRGKSAATFYIMGNMDILSRPLLALLPSSKPSEKEIYAAAACIEAIAQPGVAILVGYGPHIERPGIRIALERGADVALILSEGILNFKVRQDLQDSWDIKRVLVLSAAKPNQKWSPNLAFRARDLQLTIAKAILITDPSPNWFSRSLKKGLPSHLPKIFYVNYYENDSSARKIFGNLHAFPVGKSIVSGIPNVESIKECLNIIRPPNSKEAMPTLTEPHVHKPENKEAVKEGHKPQWKQQTFIEEDRGNKGIKYPKRLIEVDLPIKRISAHARREKSIRHGHISTLHIWWARRPLAACRAVICASLWPDPADELCPEMFHKVAREQMTKWAKNYLKLLSQDSWSRFVAISKDEHKLDGLLELRTALLDFIADFANWDNSTVPEYLKTSRLLTQAAHEALGGAPGSRPQVMDPFAGGGAIPLEALRVGADSFASDINSLPILLNEVLLQDLPEITSATQDQFLYWAKKLRKDVQDELDELFPIKEAHGKPFAYFWARQIRCEAPNCGKIVPLIGNPVLRKMAQSIAIGFDYRHPNKHPSFSLYNIDDSHVRKTVRGGSATCVCGVTTPVESVRRQLQVQEGGAYSSLLLAVGVLNNHFKKKYILPNGEDKIAIEKAFDLYKDLIDKTIPNAVTLVFPNEKIWGKARMNIGLYGIDQWSKAFTPRQKIQIYCFQKKLAELSPRIKKEAGIAVLKLLVLSINKIIDYCTSLCRWVPRGEFVAATNGSEKKIPMMWDYVEVVQHGDGPGSYMNMVEWVSRVIKHLKESKLKSGIAMRANATKRILPEDSVDVLFTDPPYYDAIWYCDLSDLFDVWLQRTLLWVGLPSNICTTETREAEIIRSDFSAKDGLTPKDDSFYEINMQKAFVQSRIAAKPNALGVIVFAHKSTSGWETILKGLIESGWIVVASWPIDTEREARMTAIGQAALSSSIHIICRPRKNLDGSLRQDDIGDWRDVLSELPKRIHEWMPRLAEEGVVGADAIFACLGPALEIYSRYSSVEKASGEKVDLKEYLEEVWAAVSREALNMIFEGADASGFDEDARLTAMWLWTVRTALNGNNGKDDDIAFTKSLPGYSLEYDAARKIAQGLGAHLENLTHLVEIKGSTAVLLSAAARAHYLFGKDAAEAPKRKQKKKSHQLTLFDVEKDIKQIKEESGGWVGEIKGKPGSTVLDQLHQCMILFGAGRGEAMKRFLVEEGVGRNPLFWRLAQALSALYPTGTDEKRWIDGVLARKKGLGL